MEYVTIIAHYENADISYDVPAKCRYFVANELVNMGAESVTIGKVFVKDIELATA